MRTASLPIARCSQAKLAGLNLDQTLRVYSPAIVRFRGFLVDLTRCSCRFQTAPRTLDLSSGLVAVKLIMRSLIGIPEPSPAAHAVNEDEVKIGIPGYDGLQQFLQPPAVRDRSSRFP